jgi:hypothetical protein
MLWTRSEVSSSASNPQDSLARRASAHFCSCVCAHVERSTSVLIVAQVLPCPVFGVGFVFMVTACTRPSLGRLCRLALSSRQLEKHLHVRASCASRTSRPDARPLVSILRSRDAIVRHRHGLNCIELSSTVIARKLPTLDAASHAALGHEPVLPTSILDGLRHGAGHWLHLRLRRCHRGHHCWPTVEPHLVEHDRGLGHRMVACRQILFARVVNRRPI